MRDGRVMSDLPTAQDVERYAVANTITAAPGAGLVPTAAGVGA